MSPTTQEVKEVRASADFRKLQEKIKPIVGLPCLRADFTYGGKLVLHLGEPVPYTHPKLKGKTHGSWRLALMATPYVLSLPQKDPNVVPGRFLGGFPIILGGAPIMPENTVIVEQDAYEKGIAEQLTGTKVAEVTFRPWPTDLAISFDNGAFLQLLSKYAEPDPDFPVWELLTPNKSIVMVFGEPSPTWTFLRSDVSQRP
jgi:hypothetical protein